jgi:hypothetical protein
MFTTADYPKLTQKLNEVFTESAALAMEEWKGKDIFDVMDTDWKTYDYLVMHGTGSFQRVAEGSELPTVSSNEGDSAAFTQKRYGEKVMITKDMRMFDRYDQMKDAVESAVDEAFNRIDQSMADALLNGFSGTTYTDVYGDTVSNLAVDGVVLFSATHTNNINSRTFRNLIRNSAGTANPGLSRDAIVKARADGRTYRDPNGVNRPVTLDTLIVSANKEDLAERLIFSTGVATTPNVDINPLKGKINKIMVWSKLDQRSDGTDTSGYWFLADGRRVKKCLKAPFAQKPTMQAAEQVTDSQNWLYPLDGYYALGLGYPAYIFGSTGVN